MLVVECFPAPQRLYRWRQMNNSKPSFTSGRRWAISFDVGLRTALVLAVVVMVNYLGAKFYGRFYLSSQTRVQLSSRTLSVIHSITNQITVTVYYDKTDDWYPSIIALLNEYRSANPKISVKTVDYVRDAGEAQKIRRNTSSARPRTRPGHL